MPTCTISFRTHVGASFSHPKKEQVILKTDSLHFFYACFGPAGLWVRIPVPTDTASLLGCLRERVWTCQLFLQTVRVDCMTGLESVRRLAPKQTMWWCRVQYTSSTRDKTDLFILHIDFFFKLPFLMFYQNGSI